MILRLGEILGTFILLQLETVLSVAPGVGICPPNTAGYKADPATSCETYYYCHADGMKEQFSCPLGMAFDERLSRCDQWNNVICPGSAGEPFLASLDPANSQQQLSGLTYPNGPTPAYPPNNAQPTPNPMDFLAALLFPPVAGRPDVNDFMNTAPSGVRNSFMRVAAGEGQMNAAFPPSQQFPPNPYVEPLSSSPMMRNGFGNEGLMEGPTRNREGPGSFGQARRPLRPSPGMNPLDGQGAFDSGPVPPHLMGGHSPSTFGQLSLNYSALSAPANMQMPPFPPMSPFGPMPPPNPMSPMAAFEALRPLWQSLMQNPNQPHLRRMATLIAGGGAPNMMSQMAGAGNGGLGPHGKLKSDVVGAAADPTAALGTAKSSKKALDDGLVDARR